MMSAPLEIMLSIVRPASSFSGTFSAVRILSLGNCFFSAMAPSYAAWL